MNQSFWASNIKLLRQRKNLSQEDVATQLGIKRSKLSAHENGQTANPPVEELFRFSAYFKIGIDSLLKVDLAKLSEKQVAELEWGNDSYAKGTKLRVLATTVDSGNNDNVELVPLKARAGYTAGYGDPEFIAKLPVFSMPHLPGNRKYRMFPISGDSMHPVPDGAYIIGEYLEDWTQLEHPLPCIVVTGSEGIVFKIANLQQGDVRRLRLESLNTEYKPYEVPVEDVLEVWRFRSMVTDVLPEKADPAQEMARMVREIGGDVKKLLAKANAKHE